MSGSESGWEGVDFKGFRFDPNFGCRERGGETATMPRFCSEDTRNLTQRPPRNAQGYWVDGGRVLSEATSEMSPLPRFDSACASVPRFRSGLRETDLPRLRVSSHQ